MTKKRINNQPNLQEVDKKEKTDPFQFSLFSLSSFFF